MIEEVLVLQLPLKKTALPGMAQATQGSYVKAARGLDPPCDLGRLTSDRDAKTRAMRNSSLKRDCGLKDIPGGRGESKY